MRYPKKGRNAEAGGVRSEFLEKSAGWESRWLEGWRGCGIAGIGAKTTKTVVKLIKVVIFVGVGVWT